MLGLELALSSLLAEREGKTPVTTMACSSHYWVTMEITWQYLGGGSRMGVGLKSSSWAGRGHDLVPAGSSTGCVTTAES